MGPLTSGENGSGQRGCAKGHDLLAYSPQDGLFYTNSEIVANELREDWHTVRDVDASHWVIIPNPVTRSAKISDSHIDSDYVDEYCEYYSHLPQERIIHR